jgi:uncharacterized membrane protein
MTTSIYLAKLMGPVFLAIGLGLLLNAKTYRKLAEEFVESSALIYLSGVLLMLGGVALLLAHNVWTLNWPFLITALGWLAVIGGAVRIIVPQGSQEIGRDIVSSSIALTIACVVWLAIGVVLCFFGYVW